MFDLENCYDIHIGVERHNRQALNELLKSMSLDFYDDGDSWEEWSEPTGNPDVDGYHFVIRYPDAELNKNVWFLDFYFILNNVPLKPMENHGQRGTIAIQSLSSDWSEQFFTYENYRMAHQGY